jgi:4-hydroxybenzoate polyprenyltransferase
MNQLVGIVQLIRPAQWVKNLIVFTAVLFSPAKVVVSSPVVVWVAFQAFAAFCILSSGVYSFNDLLDLSTDRLHPKKKNRPLPSGRVKPAVAVILAIVLIGSGISWAFLLEPKFGWIAAGYLLTNIVYSLGLKHMVILDVLLLSSGFVYRAVSGVVVISPLLKDSYLSYWLILCTFLLSLFLALAKRRHEIVLLGDAAAQHRASLAEYSLPFIDQMIAILSAATLVSYSLYTISDDTYMHYGTHDLFWTLPFVVYGLFRYLYLIHHRTGGGDPTWMLLHDKPTLINVILWGLCSAGIVYLR